MVYGKKITLSTKGFSDIKNITEDIKDITGQSGIKDGLVNVSVIGSTASVSTIEYEPALVEDMRDQLEEFISRNKHTRHSQTWGDDNGFSHLRATFMGPGITVPVSGGNLILGTWQQIVVIDHDNRPRSREVFIQVMGEK
ncbi:MAG: secondary thiamine-phosphate synthase enzyme YjbQ [Actinomycetota bacterium]|nr:secondary thiamine-phosphate synthase enzyme YjbQ [Actinomycetota bacterium]